MTGIRISALISLRLKYVDLDDKSVTQNPREVATKLGKSMHTFVAKGFPEAESALLAWKSTKPARKIVNAAFTAAGLHAFGPHRFRHMLARHATKNCTSVAEFVATSQNLGHTDVLTTLRSYGQIDRDRVRELITGESGGDELED